MHTGDRTSEAIGADGILPGYTGTIVRDSYKGYEHLTNALHAWCGAQYAERRRPVQDSLKRTTGEAYPLGAPRPSCWPWTRWPTVTRQACAAG